MFPGHPLLKEPPDPLLWRFDRKGSFRNRQPEGIDAHVAILIGFPVNDPGYVITVADRDREE